MVSGKPLYTVNQIQEKVRELADRISADYKNKDLVAITILKGAFMFSSDLIRYIQVPMTIDFLIASSYMKDTSTGEVKIHSDIKENIRDKDVLLIEDIIDTGVTINYLREHYLQRGPRSLKICTLLDKHERRIVEVPIDYIGYRIPNEFVVGYGLDYENKFRNLPYIAIFKKSSKKE